MASRLTSAAYYSRRTFKWFGIGVVVYLVLYIIWSMTASLRYREPPPPPIVPKFRISKTLNFPPSDPNVKFTYRLETATGALPTGFPDRGVVYKNKAKNVNFGSYGKAVKVAKGLGFVNKPLPLSPPMYEWKKGGRLPGILQIDIVSLEFDMVKNWVNDRNLFLTKKAVSESQMYSIVQSFMKKSGLLNDDLVKKGSHSVKLFRQVNGQLVKVDALVDADVFQVNFRRGDINNLHVVHTDPDRPPVWGLVTRGGQVLEAHFHYWPTGTESSEYPLRSIRSVWNDLLEGNVYIARVGDNIPGSEVVIRHFELGYYISNDFQQFTEPVYVIKGDNGFMAYAQAINRVSK